jgi:hypothetical protein
MLADDTTAELPAVVLRPLAFLECLAEGTTDKRTIVAEADCFGPALSGGGRASRERSG